MGNQDLHNVCLSYDIEVIISGIRAEWKQCCMNIFFLQYCDSGHRCLNLASDEQDMWNTGEPRNANKILDG
jgi:hypothetical protein